MHTVHLSRGREMEIKNSMDLAGLCGSSTPVGGRPAVLRSSQNSLALRWLCGHGPELRKSS